ncbi:GGDEF domain-containing protein [Vibrio alfacsensis]|uniref:GGDEF domain-containing protein n=1 Tax=Vibrio alfacsensis TaxID=1074311 RepID=UPI001BEEEAAF|nr:GGDEF domain-containing protein [Vibrio alfacsensis]BBM63503.1 GGDEF domain-containing protein [Vibrio alfacsensis]BCN25362.1 GGDEF domain-containing protein [Vibrio alfacsensis]
MILKERGDWLHAILNSLPDHVFILDEQGRYIESFGGTYHSNNFNAESYTNLYLNDVLSPQKASELLGYIDDVIRSKQPKVVKYSIALQDHLLMPIEELEALENPEETWFEAIIQPVENPENNNNWVTWSVRNVTKTHLLEKRLKQLSETDELTGMLNRRAFLSRLDDALSAQSSRSQTLSCIMIDIDHFKEINDQVGHFSGDKVICDVAKICQSAIRSSDFIGRLGGEEFAVILTNTSAIQAYDVAERIRQSVQNTSCQVDDIEINTTVSIGVAEHDEENPTARQLMIRADKAMYYSKHTGRNLTTLHHKNIPDIKSQPSSNLRIQKVS